MKKALLIVLVLGLAVSAAFAVDFTELDFEAYAGFSMSQYKAEGLKDATLWGNTVALSEANGSKLAYGATLGVRTALVDHLYVFTEADVNFSSMKTYVIDAALGGLFYFVDSGFHLGIGAKAGFFSLVNYLATINFNYYGYDKNGKYFSGNKGDSITYDVMGLFVTPFLDMSFDVGKMLSIGATVGYKLGFSFKDAVMVAGKHDIGKLPDQDPKVSPNGLTASLYVLYRF